MILFIKSYIIIVESFEQVAMQNGLRISTTSVTLFLW
jgi:hypothetical protein